MTGATMRRVVSVMLLLTASSPVVADYDAGLEAHKQGDYAAALREFRTVAEQGNASAQFALGFMYRNGQGTPEDHRRAAFWYRKAAEQGDAKAQTGLGLMYDNGEGVPEDDHQAVLWYRRAAEQGHAGAQTNLGFMYGNGEGVPEDDHQAMLWYRKAAEQGYARAQTNLGLMYDDGEGVPEDDSQAVHWYRKAAEQENADAQYYLGLMYDDGEGVPEDDSQAVLWYRKAAGQGHADAQYYLGLMYDYGEGVPEDDVHAYTWFNLAAAQGHEEAELSRTFSRLDMTRGQMAEAQRFSRELAAWIAEGGSGPSPTLVSTAQQEPTEPVGSGSGFLVGRQGEIVTNHHVVDGCARVTVHRAGTSHDATVRAVDADADLALLKVSPEIGETATFSNSPRTSLGEGVTVAGYPLRGLLSGELNVTSGNVSALAGQDNDPKRLQITAPVQQGNSGGPLLDSAGNVVGVVVSKLDPLRAIILTGDIPQNVNFAIKGALVRGFLDIHGVVYDRRPSTAKLTSERLAELAHTFTVAVHCWE